MSIPILKKLPTDRTGLQGIPPLPEAGRNAGPGIDQTPGRKAATRRSSRGRAIALGMTAALALLIVTVPPVHADTLIWFEDFDDETVLSSPDGTGEGYVFSVSNANTFVSQLHSNDAGADVSGNSLRYVGTAATNSATFTYSGYNICLASFAFWVYLPTLPAVGDTDTFTFTGGSGTGYVFSILDNGQVRITTTGSAGGPNALNVPGAIISVNTWTDFVISDITPGNAACSSGVFQSATLSFSQTLASNGGTITTPINNIQISQTGLIGTENRPIFVDDLQFNTGVSDTPVITGNQVAITNLVGYSMDAKGEHIIVRYNGGADVATYGTQDLSTQLASVATGCSRSDGVVVTNINEVAWITYAECNDSAGLVDTLVIRDQNLAVPIFPNECEGFPEDEPTTEDNGLIGGRVDIPEGMSQIGTLSDMSFDYEECINPSGPAIGAFAGWTLSNTDEGWIGAFAVGYGQNGIGLDTITSRAQHPALLDTSSAPYQVDDFCSWVGTDGNDYIAGVSQDGVAAIYQVIRNVVVSSTNGVNGPNEENIEFTFIQKFRNAGPYAGSNSVACAQNKVAFQTPTEIRILTNVTEGQSPFILRTIPNPASDARGLAFTGSGSYLAYLTPSSGINIHQIITGNTTGIGAKPTGIWRGMEYDFSGQNLAAFTSTLITLFDSEEVTCELDGNCEQLGNVGDDQPGPTTSSTQTSTGGTGGGAVVDSPYFWVLIWLAIANILVAILSWKTRAAFGGSVYFVVSAVVYIIGMIAYGTDQVMFWPLVATISLVIGLAIKGFVR